MFTHAVSMDKTVATCKNSCMKILEPYRHSLDAIDAEIVALLAQRLTIIREVGALKAREGIPAVLPDRVAKVREQAATWGEEAGLDPAVVRAFYTLLIDYACRVEEEIIAAATPA